MQRRQSAQDSLLSQTDTSFVSSADTGPTSSSPSASSPATSTHNHSPNPTQKPTYSPPASTSEYRWRPHQVGSQRIWWRKVDAMANFILHWQSRFYQHGDMFASCTLSLPPSYDLSSSHLREAMRRLRFNHPTIALRLAKREGLGIEKLDIPKFLEEEVDLQVALVYDVVESEEEVEAWLDEVVIFHPESRQEEVSEFEDFLTKSTAAGVQGRDRLKVHFWPADGNRGLDARIAIEQSHSVSEGIGTLIVFNLLLESLASVLSTPERIPLAWGGEVCRLEPALQDAIADPPTSWDVSATELKAVQKVNADRMNSKATPPSFIDRLGGKIVSATLRNHTSTNPFRSKLLNAPLVGVCRGVAEKGQMLPLGLLPQTGKPFNGKITHTGIISESLTEGQTKNLLNLLKRRELTLAPFMEAVGHMATIWVRKQRGLVPSPKKNGGYDDPNRILGSFSNAISKRDTLRLEHKRYLGLCMSGFPTKIAASSAAWSAAAELDTTPSPTDLDDRLPNISSSDLNQLFCISQDLAGQYSTGRNNPDWLRYDKALMFSTMHTEYLFLRGSEHYPSMPWLSSIGRVENVFASSHFMAGEERLEVHNLQLVGRVGIRQPILHVYTFRGQTKLQCSFAEWLYETAGGERRKLHGKQKGGHAEVERQNIVRFWLQVCKGLIEAVLRDEEATAKSPRVS